MTERLDEIREKSEKSEPFSFEHCDDWADIAYLLEQLTAMQEENAELKKDNQRVKDVYGDEVKSHSQYTAELTTRLSTAIIECAESKEDAERDYDTYTNMVIKLAEEKQHNATLTKALEMMLKPQIENSCPSKDFKVAVGCPQNYDLEMCNKCWMDYTLSQTLAINSKEGEQG